MKILGRTITIHERLFSYRWWCNLIYGNGHTTPETFFKDTLTRTEHLKQFAHQQPCPCCAQKNRLKILMYEVGRKGWEFKVFCSNCNSQGVVNDSGFHVDLTVPVKQTRKRQ